MTVIGGGVVGIHAARMALELGAEVTILERTLARLRELDNDFGGGVRTLFSTHDAIEAELRIADTAIGGEERRPVADLGYGGGRLLASIDSDQESSRMRDIVFWRKHRCLRWLWPCLVSILMGPAAGATWAESGGRLLYHLNCMGCHPMPEHDHGAFGGEVRFVGAFYQTEAGRRFFIRMPQAGSPRLSAGDDAQLVDEITTWKGACLALTASTPLIQYRHRNAGR